MLCGPTSSPAWQVKAEARFAGDVERRCEVDCGEVALVAGHAEAGQSWARVVDRQSSGADGRFGPQIANGDRDESRLHLGYRVGALLHRGEMLRPRDGVATARDLRGDEELRVQDVVRCGLPQDRLDDPPKVVGCGEHRGGALIDVEKVGEVLPAVVTGVVEDAVEG